MDEIILAITGILFLLFLIVVVIVAVWASSLTDKQREKFFLGPKGQGRR